MKTILFETIKVGTYNQIVFAKEVSNHSVDRMFFNMQ